jgi:hypothetical protein
MFGELREKPPIQWVRGWDDLYMEERVMVMREDAAGSQRRSGRSERSSQWEAGLIRWGS